MMTKYCGLRCNEKFLNIYTCSDSGWVQKDLLGKDIYLDLLADCETIGESMLKALVKSRDLCISEEDRQALIDGKITREWIDDKYPERKLYRAEPCAELFEMWEKGLMRKYGYRTKGALRQHMQSVDVLDDGDLITFYSYPRLVLFTFYLYVNEVLLVGRIAREAPPIELTIPSTSSTAIVGAATRYAIGNCRGQGADFIRNMLFPDGQPKTFEEYLAELGLNASKD